MFKKLAILTATFCFTTAHAVESEYLVGAGTGFSSRSFSYFDGATKQQVFITPLELLSEYKPNRIHRYVLNWQIANYSAKATKDNIGANISGYYVEFAWLRRAPVARHFKPWFGVGLRSAYLNSTLRYTINSEGFLSQHLPDNSETTFSLILKANNEFEFSDNWIFDLAENYDIALGNGMNGFEFVGSIKYRF
ncbi:MAG: hypothetical protein OEY10_01885 [Nitrosopumilus sp.]|nr:hypothetical protein [Nitrosopumilus sp.]MDH5727362.1 hypothetical protein [Gammaproteobacteria bacterium]